MNKLGKLLSGAVFGVGVLALTATSASAAIVCNRDGDCWHVPRAYAYQGGWGLTVHPNNWRWGMGDRTQHAPTFEGVFQCQSPRTDAPTLSPPEEIHRAASAPAEGLNDLHQRFVPRLVDSPDYARASAVIGRGNAANRGLTSPGMRMRSHHTFRCVLAPDAPR